MDKLKTIMVYGDLLTNYFHNRTLTCPWWCTVNEYGTTSVQVYLKDQY